MVDRDRVLAEPARRLDQEHHVAGLDRGQHDLVAVVDEEPARCLAPGLGDPVHEGGRQVGGPAPVVVDADPHVALVELRGREPLLVLTARGDQRVDQRVAGLRVIVELEPGDRAGRAEVVARVTQAAQQPDRGHRGVQADGVADARVLGRVRREHQRESPLPGWDVAQTGVVDGDSGDPGTALGVGDVPREAVGVDLLERERRGDDPPVELRDRDLVGRVERGDTVVVGLPLLAAAGEAEPLQDGDVERLQPLDVPRLVVLAGAGSRGTATTGGEHRHDERVEGAECGVQLVGRRAQRRREDRYADRLARGVDGVGERVREGGVPARLVGAVVQHPHAWPLGG